MGHSVNSVNGAARKRSGAAVPEELPGPSHSSNLGKLKQHKTALALGLSNVSPRAVCKGNRKAAITTPGLDIKDAHRTRVTVLSPALRAAFLLGMEPPPALVVSTPACLLRRPRLCLNHAARTALLMDPSKGSPRPRTWKALDFQGSGSRHSPSGPLRIPAHHRIYNFSPEKTKVGL